VRDENNQAIRSVTALAANMAVTVELSDGSFSAVTQPSSAFKTSSPSSRAAGKKRSAVSKDESKQQNLFD
jgi:Exonuclease VII, large subunit